MDVTVIAADFVDRDDVPEAVAPKAATTYTANFAQKADDAKADAGKRCKRAALRLLIIQIITTISSISSRTSNNAFKGGSAFTLSALFEPKSENVYIMKRFSYSQKIIMILKIFRKST